MDLFFIRNAIHYTYRRILSFFAFFEPTKEDNGTKTPIYFS
jgi:hypothetical protein